MPASAFFSPVLFLSGVLCAAFFFAVSTRLSFAAAASSTIVIVLARQPLYLSAAAFPFLHLQTFLPWVPPSMFWTITDWSFLFPLLSPFSSSGWILFSSASLCCACSITGADCPKALTRRRTCLFVSFLGVQPLRSRDFFLRNGLEPAMWDPETTQACNGFLLNFTAMYGFSRPSEPQGYSTQVKQIAQQYPATWPGDASGPNIIFIMNRSWADFTRADPIGHLQARDSFHWQSRQ